MSELIKSLIMFQFAYPQNQQIFCCTNALSSTLLFLPIQTCGQSLHALKYADTWAPITSVLRATIEGQLNRNGGGNVLIFYLDLLLPTWKLESVSSRAAVPGYAVNKSQEK